MTLLKVLKYPDPELLKISKPIERFDARLKTLEKNMFETMHFEKGIGLAAPQVGKLIRMVVIEIPQEEEPSIQLTLCNPIILKKTGHARIEEGCLSLPGFYVGVDRAKTIDVQAQDTKGEPFQFTANGLLSICIQHEIDHLDGKLLANYAEEEQLQKYRSEIKALK